MAKGAEVSVYKLLVAFGNERRQKVESLLPTISNGPYLIMNAENVYPTARIRNLINCIISEWLSLRVCHIE